MLAFGKVDPSKSVLTTTYFHCVDEDKAKEFAKHYTKVAGTKVEETKSEKFQEKTYYKEDQDEFKLLNTKGEFEAAIKAANPIYKYNYKFQEKTYFIKAGDNFKLLDTANDLVGAIQAKTEIYKFHGKSFKQLKSSKILREGMMGFNFTQTSSKLDKPKQEAKAVTIQPAPQPPVTQATNEQKRVPPPLPPKNRAKKAAPVTVATTASAVSANSVQSPPATTDLPKSTPTQVATKNESDEDDVPAKRCNREWAWPIWSAFLAAGSVAGLVVKKTWPIALALSVPPAVSTVSSGLSAMCRSRQKDDSESLLQNSHIQDGPDPESQQPQQSQKQSKRCLSRLQSRRFRFFTDFAGGVLGGGVTAAVSYAAGQHDPKVLMEQAALGFSLGTAVSSAAVTTTDLCSRRRVPSAQPG